MPATADDADLTPDASLLGLARQLHAGHYTPLAWWRFLAASGRQALAIRAAAPNLVRSWLRLAIGGGATIGVVALAAGVRTSIGIALLLTMTSLAWWALLMGAIFLHLGLMVEVDTGRSLLSIGLPNSLTIFRAFAAVWVLWAIAYSAGGNFLPLALIFGAAMVTDVADGFLARRAHRVTRWGRLYDPMVDGILFGSAAVGLALRGIFPGWLAALVVFRYAFPVAGAALFLLVRRRTLKVRHTLWGQVSTLSIAVAVFLAAVLLGLGREWDAIAPGIYAAVAVAMVLALLTIVRRGLEQA